MSLDTMLLAIFLYPYGKMVDVFTFGTKVSPQNWFHFQALVVKTSYRTCAVDTLLVSAQLIVPTTQLVLVTLVKRCLANYIEIILYTEIV